MRADTRGPQPTKAAHRWRPLTLIGAALAFDSSCGPGVDISLGDVPLPGPDARAASDATPVEADAVTAFGTHILTASFDDNGSASSGFDTLAGVSPSDIVANVDFALSRTGSSPLTTFLDHGGRRAGLVTDLHRFGLCDPSSPPCSGSCTAAQLHCDANAPSPNGLQETSFLHAHATLTGTTDDRTSVLADQPDGADTVFFLMNGFDASFLAVVSGDAQPSRAASFTTGLVQGAVVTLSQLEYFQPARTLNWPPYEYASDADVEQATRAIIDAYGLPVMLDSGFDENETFVFGDDPNVTGTLESCAVVSEGATSSQFIAGKAVKYYAAGANQAQYGNRDTGWDSRLSHLLQVQASGRFAGWSECGTSGWPDGRLYGLASLWLVFDPARTVRFADYGSPVGGHPASIYAENELIPSQPRSSAAGMTVDALRDPVTGAYVREFAECSRNGVTLGACAAVVNPTPATIAYPTLTEKAYGHSLSLDAKSQLAGGLASFAGAIPSSLPPATAVIVGP